MQAIAIPRHQRRTDLITSTVLKLHSSGMTDEEMRLAIGSIYEAHCSKSTISSITDAVIEGVRGFSKRPIPRRLFAIFLDSTYVPLRRDTVAKEAVNIALGVTDVDEAIYSSYPKAKRQRCFVHLLRNACSKVRAADRREAADGSMSIARQEDAESGKKPWMISPPYGRGNTPSSGYGRRGRSICSPSMSSLGNSAASSTRTTGSNRSTSR